MNAMSPADQEAGPQPAREHLDPAVIRLIVVLLTGAIPSLLDTSIVNVAADTIGRDLHTTVPVIQWVITGYLLSFAMVIPLSGWALARFGGRAVWMFSLALFLAGSVACGAAWNIGSLIAFRVVQGIGGGMMTPLITTLLVRAVGTSQIGRLMAAISLPVVVVPIFGPVIAGLIISNISWRWIFYVNVPMCLAGLLLAGRQLPASRPPGPASRPPGGASRIDLAGLALLPPALVALLYGLAEVSTEGGFGHAGVIIALSAGVALLAAYCVHALRTSATPMVDLRLFRARTFTGATALLFLAGLSIYGAMLLLPLYFQQVRHDSALTAGLLMVPQGLGSIAPRTLAGKLTDRIGPRLVVLAGIALAAFGTIPFALAGLHTNDWLLGGALVVRGAGLGLATIAVMAGAFRGLSRQQVPDASSATRIVQFVGGSFGAAVLVAVILDRQAAAHAAAGATGLATAYAHTFWWCVGFTALALIPALFLSSGSRMTVPPAQPSQRREPAPRSAQ
jgi:EmrB/QacA subfamily drug resistance transporter